MATTLGRRAKSLVRYAMVPVLYRSPPAGLMADRLAIYLKALVDRAHLSGDVAEVGCSLGGVAILANRALRLSGWTGTYICYDTFDGFVDEQFDEDRHDGTEPDRRFHFGASSEALVRRIFRQQNSDDIRTVKGDIARVPDSEFSERYIAALIDVDLSIPTYEGLKKVYPRLVPGGVIYVDDCPPDCNWKARRGYERFVQEFGLPEEYTHGLAVVHKPA